MHDRPFAKTKVPSGCGTSLLTYLTLPHTFYHLLLCLLRSLHSRLLSVFEAEMAFTRAIIDGSAKYPKPQDRSFQYGTAGVSNKHL